MESLETYFYLFKWGLISGTLFALSSAFTSPYLILQRNSLFPHALTHILFLSLFVVSLLSSSIPIFLKFPLLVIITLILSLGIFVLHKFTPIYEDTATSLLTYFSLALALVIANKTSQYDITLLNYLFGSLIVVSEGDVYESFFVFILSALIYLKYKDLWLTQCIDREIPGLHFKRAHLAFILLLTLQTIVGVKLMGVLLVAAFFVYSGVLALRFAPSFNWVLPLNAIFNFLAIFWGFLLSVFFDLPFSSSAIIVMSSYIFLIFLKRG